MPNLLSIKISKEYISLISNKSKNNYFVSLFLTNKAPLIILILLAFRKILPNLLLLIPNISINLNPIKLRLADINNIFILINI